MKYGTIVSLCLAAAVSAKAASCDNLNSLLAQVQEEATRLLPDSADGQEVSSLISQLTQLTNCEQVTSYDDGSSENDSTSDVDAIPAPGPTSGFNFAVGQSWNYNLNTPVDTTADVDVFFIDMGEVEISCFRVGLSGVNEASILRPSIRSSYSGVSARSVRGETSNDTCNNIEHVHICSRCMCQARNFQR